MVEEERVAAELDQVQEVLDVEVCRHDYLDAVFAWKVLIEKIHTGLVLLTAIFTADRVTAFEKCHTPCSTYSETKIN